MTCSAELESDHEVSLINQQLSCHNPIYQCHNNTGLIETKIVSAVLRDEVNPSNGMQCHSHHVHILESINHSGGGRPHTKNQTRLPRPM